MKLHGVEGESFHYGAIVDSFARMRTPEYIHMAICFLKQHPIAHGQYAFNAILSRCVPEMKPSEEDIELKEIIKENISLAQEMVIYFHEKGFRYEVLEKTHWRLKKSGLNWPRTVRY